MIIEISEDCLFFINRIFSLYISQHIEILIFFPSLFWVNVQAIIDCRFFTLFAVAGTLLGSGLCFVEVTAYFFFQQKFRTMTLFSFFFTYIFLSNNDKDIINCMQGCFTILEAYLQYFHALSHKSDQGHVMQLLIEAIGISLNIIFMHNQIRLVHVKK